MNPLPFKTLFRRESFTRGAAILTLLTFSSYLLGLVRDRIFARTFGAGKELDVYNASFIIPDLLLNILVAGALASAFIPVFTSLRATGKPEEANELGNTVLHSAAGAILLFGGLAAIFMPWLAPFVAPGFSDAQNETLVTLTRLMLISPLIMAVSNSFGAMLVSFRSFLPYGLSPIFYNLGIIGGALTARWLGIYGLVLGTLIGAVLHLLPRLAAIKASPFRYTMSLRAGSASFRQVIKLMIPKMLGHPVEQLNFLAFTRIASHLTAGSIAVIGFARNFQSVPVSLFGISFSLAIFPLLAECAGKGDREAFLKNFKKALRDILLLTIPSAIFLFFGSELPIRIFLGGGRFSDENILRTATVLSVFALSVPTESLVHLLARSFYALKNTITPVIISIIGLVIGVSYASFAAPIHGILAIPYAFFLGSASEVVLLAFLLMRRLRSSPSGPL